MQATGTEAAMTYTVTNLGASPLAPKKVTEQLRTYLNSKNPEVASALSTLGTVKITAGKCCTMSTEITKKEDKFTTTTTTTTTTRATPPTPPPPGSPTPSSPASGPTPPPVTQAPVQVTSAPKVVTTTLTITNTDYTKLMQNDTVKALVESEIKTSVLASLPTGYTKDHLTVSFSAGSVVAKVDITPLAGADTAALATTVTNAKSTIETASATAVKNMPAESLNSILADGMTKDDIQVTATDAMEQATPSPSPSPTPTDTSGASSFAQNIY